MDIFLLLGSLEGPMYLSVLLIEILFNDGCMS